MSPADRRVGVTAVLSQCPKERIHAKREGILFFFKDAFVAGRKAASAVTAIRLPSQRDRTVS